MKYVAKGQSPAVFEEWKAQANADWKPTYSDLRNPQKRILHEALLLEQGWVCCYCGRPVTMEDSHIEHFRPQHAYSELQLSYENLHASCLRELKPGLPLHCGHAKADNFDEQQHIAPPEPTCEHRFMYTLRGDIVPAAPTDERAAYMASLLALNSPFLRDTRAEVLNKTLDAAFLASASVEELEQLRDAFRRRDREGKLPGFGHVVARYAEQYIAGLVDEPARES